MKHSEIYSLRKTYSKHSLDEKEVNPDPVLQFQQWLEEALKAEVEEPYAFNIATVDAKNRPDTRVVLLRSANHSGFSFFTNYNSVKGQNLAVNTNACFNFFWAGLERQVRIHGTIERLSEAESDGYFNSRPRESQIGAWASLQSEVIPSREYLEKRVKQLTKDYADSSVMRPPHWGGYILKPNSFEFWQGRPSRLHDRILYTLIDKSNLAWKIERLSP